jgi:hypothetical protein
LIAILFGFLPGCGPQIVVTTFYLNGFIPLSAEIGNAISNDGDDDGSEMNIMSMMRMIMRMMG